MKHPGDTIVVYTDHLTLCILQERYRSLIPSYIRDCSVAIVVFDITREWSSISASQIT